MSIFSDFQNMIFPEYCLACHGPVVSGEEAICSDCRHEIPVTDFHLLPDNPLMMRFMGKVPIANALAYTRFVKGGRVQKLLYELKYNHATEVGVMFGRWYGHILNDTLPNTFDVVVPVPLHISRLKTRGYNQSEFFGQGLAEVLELSLLAQGLERTKATATQTRKQRFERWENVGEVFRVTDPATIEGKHVLLVDDVVTTGSTLEACANTLLKSGALEVSIAAIAMAT